MSDNSENNKNHYLHQYLVDEAIEDYTEGHLSRRGALTMLAGLTGAAMAMQLLDACTTAPAAKSGDVAPAAKPPDAPKSRSPLSVAADDPAVIAEPIEFMSGDAKIMGYQARPSEQPDMKRPIVLVCHENRGLTPHIQDVTRRLAKAGFYAVAVDLLSREGGTAKFTFEEVPGIIGKVSPERHVQDFQAALKFAKEKPYARPNNPGMIGFCFGGGVTWRVAIGIPELKAAVPFYGPPPPDKEIGKIHAAVLAIYAGKDARINGGIPGIETAMKKGHKTFEKIIYPNVDHAFNNDTGERYNQEASGQAWDKTLAWLNKYLQS